MVTVGASGKPQSSRMRRCSHSAVASAVSMASACMASALKNAPACLNSSLFSRMEESTLFRCSKNGAHRLLKLREIARDNIPDCLEVHLKIVVYQDISHAGYRRPVDLRVPLLVQFADTTGRLAENLK